MRALGVMALLGLTACTGSILGQESRDAASNHVNSGASTPVVPQEIAGTSGRGPFSGDWQACEGAPSPAECSRYRLVQRGDRICGTWSYVASGKAYEGRLVAHAISGTEARRTQVCGRPGAETDTECGSGWQRIDKPLLLCGGGLADLTGSDGTCIADYRPVPLSQRERDELEAQPWMADCLSSMP